MPHDSEAKRLFGSIASALDSLNTTRNRTTLAHANDMLLEAPEAVLFINVSSRPCLLRNEDEVKRTRAFDNHLFLEHRGHKKRGCKSNDLQPRSRMGFLNA